MRCLRVERFLDFRVRRHADVDEDEEEEKEVEEFVGEEEFPHFVYTRDGVMCETATIFGAFVVKRRREGEREKERENRIVTFCGLCEMV